MSEKKYIIITSIFEPTEAVKKFAKIEGWQLIVVGDKKSPAVWENENTIYLSPTDQMKLGYKILDYLPWNHYCRKMIGYLYAIEQGATIIADTDDDNIPYESWPSIPDNENLKIVGGLNFFNTYKMFTDKFIWPRGLPLRLVLDDRKPTIKEGKSNVGIWQFLADEDPDVDAIYRLTNNTPIFFEKKEPIVLDEGTVCPFNSQDTIFTKDFFALLFLPAFVTFRFTDILRGLVTQPILWSKGSRVGFGPATVVQKRNPHDYMKDFVSEIPVFTEGEKAVEIAKLVADTNKHADMLTILCEIYKALEECNIVKNDEVRLVKAWAEDIKRVIK